MTSPPTTARPPALVPARRRLRLRARRAVLVVLVTMAALSSALGWVMAVVVGDGGRTGHGGLTANLGVRLALGQLLVLLVVSAVAVVVAWRSTRVIDAVFRAEDQLMVTVAHEVRTPLNRLMLAIDEDATGATGATDRPGGSSAAAEAQVLAELLEDLLETGRTMTGAAPVPDDPLRLDRVVARLVDHWGPTEATLDCDLTPVTVVGNPRLLRRAVTNLIRNAERHGYAEGPGRVAIIVDHGGVTVRDDGPGVGPSRLGRLRDDAPLSFRDGGARVGLGFARWAAEVHGGRLTVDNRAGHGFEARLVLPTVEETGGVRSEEADRPAKSIGGTIVGADT